MPTPLNIFDSFRKVQYKLPDGSTIAMPELSREVIMSNSESLLEFDQEIIQDNERPDVTAIRLYDSPEYYFLFFLLNPHLREGINSWAPAKNIHDKLIEKKYKNFISLSNVMDGDRSKVSLDGTEGAAASVLNLKPEFFEDFKFYYYDQDHEKYILMPRLKLDDYNSESDSLIFKIDDTIEYGKLNELGNPIPAEQLEVDAENEITLMLGPAALKLRDDAGKIPADSQLSDMLQTSNIFISGPAEWSDAFHYISDHNRIYIDNHDSATENIELFRLSYYHKLSYKDYLKSPKLYYHGQDIISPYQYKKMLQANDELGRRIKIMRVIDYENILHERKRVVNIPRPDAVHDILETYRDTVSI